MYRVRDGALQVLLAHPGGPYWARKDLGAWSLPKGQYESPEQPLDAACREFTEETGFTPQPPFHSLGEVRQKSGKRVQAWAFQGDCDCAELKSNAFEVEWPPRSGRMQAFAEVDRIEWFDLARARAKLLPAQVPFLDRLAEALAR
jgi:predicted NUDIX family NTP pyrophosphohydrolase